MYFIKTAVICCIVCIQDVSFPELALSRVLIGQLESSEYLTVDGVSLFHCAIGDGDPCYGSMAAHLCLAADILSAPSTRSTHLHSTSAADIILRLCSLLKQLSRTTLQTLPATAAAAAAATACCSGESQGTLHFPLYSHNHTQQTRSGLGENYQ